MSKRVAITGFGCVTPLGEEPDTVWTNLIEGRSGVGPITLFDASRFPVRIAAEVKKWDVHQHLPEADALSAHARQTQFAVACAEMAVRHAGWGNIESFADRAGVYLGCGEIFPDFAEFSHLQSRALHDDTFGRQQFMEAALETLSSRHEGTHEPAAPVGIIAGRLGLRGPSTNYTSACVSSSIAVGEATQLIRNGTVDCMLAGGAHSMIHPFGMTGFHRLSALSERNDPPSEASRPFDRNRDGFVVGEGGAVLVLEELEHARKRGATIWAEVTGYGAAHDAFRITDPHPDATSSVRAIHQALDDANVNPDQIGYINAHGSGTVANDRSETRCFRQAFGSFADRIPVSGTKSMTGHLTTACGALELMICAMAIRSGVLPPTINLQTPDPECDLDYIPLTAREVKCQHVLNNNSGFGGQNVAIVLSDANVR